MDAEGARRRQRLDAQHDSATRRCRVTHKYARCFDSGSLQRVCIELMDASNV